MTITRSAVDAFGERWAAHDLDGIMNGNLGQFTDALAAEEKRQRLEAQAV